MLLGLAMADDRHPSWSVLVEMLHFTGEWSCGLPVEEPLRLRSDRYMIRGKKQVRAFRDALVSELASSPEHRQMVPSRP